MLVMYAEEQTFHHHDIHLYAYNGGIIQGILILLKSYITSYAVYVTGSVQTSVSMN